MNTGGLAHRDDPLLDSAERPTPMIYLLDALCARPFSRDIAAGFIKELTGPSQKVLYSHGFGLGSEFRIMHKNSRDK